MKRLAALLVLLGCLTVGVLSALDFGGDVVNSSGYLTNGSPAYEQSNKLALWFNTHLGTHLFFNIQASGDYQNQTTYGGGTFSPYADLDLLTLSGQFASRSGIVRLFTFDIGRFLLADPTGDIYNQSIDGLSSTIGLPLLTVKTVVGYTGLTIKPSSTIIMSKEDLVGINDTSQYFGSPRAVGELTLSAPNLVLQQDITLSALAQLDLRPYFPNNGLIASGATTYSPSQGGALDSEYFTAKISGPIYRTLFWSGSFTLETGRTLSYLSSSSAYQYEPILAYLGTGGLHYFLPGVPHLTVGLDASYASGDADYATFYGGNTAGDATAFIPITEASTAVVFSPQLTNLLTGYLSISVKPLSWTKNRYISDLQTAVTAIPFLRPTYGPVSTGGVLTKVGSNNTQMYLGTEVDGTINYRPVSDFALGVSGGVFLPNPSAFLSSAGSIEYGGRAEASFSF